MDDPSNRNSSWHRDNPPCNGIFFATSRLTHLKPNQFFGIAFWIGFSINTLVIELWLRSHDRRSQTGVTAPDGSSPA
jgi:hypothetical protein